MSAARLLIFLQDEALRFEALETLRSAVRPIPFALHESDWNMLLERVTKTRPEALVVDLTAVPDMALAMRQLRYAAPRIKVVVLHPVPDPQMILAAMRAGVNEFVHPPLDGTFCQALERILSSAEIEIAPAAEGKLIGFLSAKGGCGATTLACHIACELQNLTGKRVLLADLDFTSGLAGFLMKTPSSYSILDAVKNLARLDESVWKAMAVKYRTNLSVLPAPASYSRWDHPDENQLRQVLHFTRTQHDWVVVDLGRSLNSVATAVLEELDQLFLVSTLEVVALHGLKTIIHGLFDQGEKLQLVMNRTPKTMDISIQELEKLLGRSLYAALPNDYMGLYQSYSSGNLLDPNSRLAQQFSLLAGKIAGVSAAKPKKKFSLF
jgi:pilus assembly protein CpaE